jgi:hypothetical protein
MKKQLKKLSLGRETLSQLASSEAFQAQGGATQHTFCTCLITAVTCTGVSYCGC